jgi:hypothetical protein
MEMYDRSVVQLHHKLSWYKPASGTDLFGNHERRSTTSGSPCLECFRIATKATSEFRIHTMEDLPEVQQRRLSTSLREVEERRLVIAVDYGTTYTGMARG